MDAAPSVSASARPDTVDTVSPAKAIQPLDIPANEPLAKPLVAQLLQRMAGAGGWLPFDDFMHAALYTPGLGYYANDSQKFGHMPHTDGSDFVTAPELSPLFGQCLADQVAQALEASGTHHVFEFGAGSGALALQICERLTQQKCGLEQYFIVEVSANLRARQQHKLAAFAERITWLDALPPRMDGVVLGNEVLDAMPVKLLVRTDGVWHERGVCLAQNVGITQGDRLAPGVGLATGTFTWQDRPTTLRPPCEIAGSHDYLTEIAPQAEAFIRTLASHMQRGVAFFIDYGFPEHEYYHPQRSMGTLMCHYQHRSDPNPLEKVGQKDITAHIDFSAIAVAGQDAGLQVLGYTSQGRFLINCGLLQKMELLTQLPRGQAAKLATEHEMGELFKVIAFGKGMEGSDESSGSFEPMGFSSGDRCHTL